VEAMQEIGIDISRYRSDRLEDLQYVLLFLLVAKHRKVTIRSFRGKENHHELSIRWILMISQSP